MLLRTFLGSAVAAGCATILCASACSSFDAAAGADSGAPATDADAAVCDTTKPWGSPARVADISTPAGDECGASRFGSDIYFGRRVTGEKYSLLRAEVAGTYKETALTFPLKIDARQPSFGPSGTTLYFVSVDFGTTKIQRSERADLGATVFSSPTLLMDTSPSAVVENAPCLGAGAVWFGSAPTSGVDFDIHRADIGANGAAAAPTAVAGVNLPGTNENYPVVTADGLRLYFGSDRNQATTNEGYDVFTATRASAAEPFGAPTIVDELSSGFDEYPTWLSADGCEMLLMRRTADEPAPHDIYRASKPR